jgi:hypothetical protein
MGVPKGRLIRARLPHPTPPASEREEQAGGEEPTEDGLVIASNPEGQVNIEVVAPVIGKPRGNSGEWTPPVIGEYDENFEGDDCDQSTRPFEFAACSIDRNGEDAANEEGPGDSVNCLYGLEPSHSSPMAQQTEPWHQSEH